MKSSVRHIYYKVCHTTLVAVCALLMVACVKVDLCMEEFHPHTGILAVSYDWDGNGIAEADRPDSMLVFANRIVNTWRCGFVTPGVGTNAEGIGGRYRFGAIHKDGVSVSTPEDSEISEEEPEDFVEGEDTPVAVQEQSIVPNDTFHVRAGEFQLLAINSEHMIHSDGQSVEDFRIEMLDEYENNLLGIRDLVIAYVERDLKTDSTLQKFGEDRKDFNHYAKYIASDSKPIYRAMMQQDDDSQEFTKAIRANSIVPVTLYPEKITQDITVSFPVIGEEGVFIDRVVAEISGIPHKMKIYSGELLTDKTLKMLFEIDIPTSEQKRDTVVRVFDTEIKDSVSARGWVSDFEETISVMGLMRNNDKSYTTGAGIMQLWVYAHTEILEEGSAHPTKKSKVIHAKINLFNTIKKAQLLKRTEADAIVQATKEGILRIDDSFLIITRDLVIQNSDDKSIDNWIEMGSDIDIDI